MAKFDDYLNDYQANVSFDESFINYYDRQGERYFYNLLKPLADTANLEQSDFIDWGSEQAYEKAVGVGECAGVQLSIGAGFGLQDAAKTQPTVDRRGVLRPGDSYPGHAVAVHAAGARCCSGHPWRMVEPFQPGRAAAGVRRCDEGTAGHPGAAALQCRHPGGGGLQSGA